MSWGLGVLFMMAHAHKSGDKILAFHARQSFLWNILVGLGLTVFMVVGFVAFLLLLLSNIIGPVSFVAVHVVVILALVIPILLNIMLNLWGAARILHGKQFFYPIVGRRCFDAGGISTRGEGVIG